MPSQLPAFQFYPRDWLAHSGLAGCSLAARGLWMHCVCVMHDAPTYGRLLHADGSTMTVEGLARRVGESPSRVKRLLDELLANGVGRQAQTVRSEDDADHLLAEWKKERRRGTLEEISRELRARERTTLDEVVRWYLDSKRGAVSKKTHVGYRQLMDLYLPESLRAMPVRALTPEMIQAQVNALAAKYKPRRVHSFLIVFRMALRSAVKRKLITESPAADVQRPRIARRRLPTFTVEQIKKFLAIADDDDYAAYWRVAVETGMRPSEMIALRWSDLQDGVVDVQRARTYTDKKDGYDEHDTKTASSRRQIRLSPTTLKSLATHKAEHAALKLQLGVSYVDSGYVFARVDGRPLSITSMLDRLHILLKDAGLPAMRLYDLRHVAATLRLVNGERPKVVSEMLATLRSTSRWTFTRT